MEPLTLSQVRVLGCLIEKALTTPEYYPLTLNSLTTACNQKSNRNPMVSYDDKTVVRALDSLRQIALAGQVIASDARVPKYKHNFGQALHLTDAQVAILCELMLRGPQTLGELRGRCKRMHDFNDLAEVETTLQQLIERPEPLVRQLPRQVGFKESRYAHLLAGEPQEEIDSPSNGNVRLESAALEVQEENQRIAQLEEQMAELRDELAALRAEFRDFRKQFE
jgi:uncharacterized protein YceH (UPF0502 family)